MTDDVTGWVVVLLFVFTIDAPGTKQLYREDVVLVPARTESDARASGLEHARAQELASVNEAGETATLSLLRVLEVTPCLDDLPVEGAVDVYCRHFQDVDAYRRFEPLLESAV